MAKLRQSPSDKSREEVFLKPFRSVKTLLNVIMKFTIVLRARNFQNNIDKVRYLHVLCEVIVHV